MTGNDIIKYDIKPLLTAPKTKAHATIVAGDFNQVRDDRTERQPPHHTTRYYAINDILKDPQYGMTSTADSLSSPIMTYESETSSSMIDHTLISDTSDIIEAFVIQTQRIDNTHTTEFGTPNLDPYTPHNQLVAMANLTSLPLLNTDDPKQEENDIQVPNQPRTEEDEKRFSDALDTKLKNDEHLNQAILPDELRGLIKNSTPGRQAELINEFMHSTRAKTTTPTPTPLSNTSE
jgi:hypothetical protein